MFYALEYTGVDFNDTSPADATEGRIPPPPDYSEIIAELQNHRRELEQLQLNFANPKASKKGVPFFKFYVLKILLAFPFLVRSYKIFILNKRKM